jgi:hypothetical protein
VLRATGDLDRNTTVVAAGRRSGHGGGLSGAAAGSLAELTDRAGRDLDEAIRRLMPRVARDLRAIVEGWSEADAYASAGASVAALMDDSPAIRGAVSRRVAVLPRLALANALADLEEERPGDLSALQAMMVEGGLELRLGATVEETACALDRLGLLSDRLDVALADAARGTVVVPARAS